MTLRQTLIRLNASLLITLLILEVLLRLFLPPPQVGVATTDTPKADLYGWAAPPNYDFTFTNPDTGEQSSFTTNSRGWKDVEHSFEKPAGTIRILFIGDSSTWGLVPLDEVYSRQVEHLLHERGYERVEVISIGISGWGTDQELEVLRLEGIQYNPDFVIYQYDDNDLTGIAQPLHEVPYDAGAKLYQQKVFAYELIDGQPQRVSLEPKRPSPNVFERMKNLFSHSAALYYMGHIIHISGEKNYGRLRSAVAPLDPLSPYFCCEANAELTPEMQDVYTLFEALIVQMKTVSEDNGAEFLMFTMAGEPAIHEWFLDHDLFETDEQGDYVMKDGMRYEVFWTRELEELLMITTRHRIPLIQPTRRYNRYQYDTHANAEGNLNMAQDIVDFLLSWEPFLEKVGG